MGSELDIDDVTAEHPVAKKELEELRDQNKNLIRVVSDLKHKESELLEQVRTLRDVIEKAKRILRMGYTSREREAFSTLSALSSAEALKERHEV